MKLELKTWIEEALLYLGLKSKADPAEIRLVELLGSWSMATDPPAGYVIASRRRLIRRIKEEGRRKAALTLNRVLQDPRSLRVALVALLLTIVFTGNTFQVASQATIPGDALYPVKLASEHLQLGASLSSTGDARLRILFSQRRLQEMESLALEGRFEYLNETAYRFEIQVNSALLLVNKIQRTDPALAETLGSEIVLTLTNQTQALAALQYMVPATSREGIQKTLRKSFEGVDAIRRDSSNNRGSEPVS